MRLKALTELAKDWGLGCCGLIMGLIKFGWLAAWVPSPDWLYRILVLGDFYQALR